MKSRRRYFKISIDERTNINFVEIVRVFNTFLMILEIMKGNIQTIRVGYRYTYEAVNFF